MDALALHEVGHIFSCCEPCVKNKRYKQIILIISFVLMTFDMVTDWINYLEWSKVGGYDQYYFVSIFQKAFLCVAAVGTGLWIIEVFVIAKKFINIYRESLERNKSVDRMQFHECLPKPEDVLKPDVGNCHTRSEIRCNLENENKYDEEESSSQTSTESDIRVSNKCATGQEPESNAQLEVEVNLQREVRNYSEEDDTSNNESQCKSNDKNFSESSTEPNEFVSESEVRHEDECASVPTLNSNKCVSKPAVRNHNESAKHGCATKEKMNNSKGMSRLGIIVRILIGILEDFAAMVVVFFPPTLPMCGVPAKQHVGSGVV